LELETEKVSTMQSRMQSLAAELARLCVPPPRPRASTLGVGLIVLISYIALHASTSEPDVQLVGTPAYQCAGAVAPPKSFLDRGQSTTATWFAAARPFRTLVTIEVLQSCCVDVAAYHAAFLAPITLMFLASLVHVVVALGVRGYRLCEHWAARGEQGVAAFEGSPERARVNWADQLGARARSAVAHLLPPRAPTATAAAYHEQSAPAVKPAEPAARREASALDAQRGRTAEVDSDAASERTDDEAASGRATTAVARRGCAAVGARGDAICAPGLVVVFGTEAGLVLSARVLSLEAVAPDLRSSASCTVEVTGLPDADALPARLAGARLDLDDGVLELEDDGLERAAGGRGGVRAYAVSALPPYDPTAELLLLLHCLVLYWSLFDYFKSYTPAGPGWPCHLVHALMLPLYKPFAPSFYTLLAHCGTHVRYLERARAPASGERRAPPSLPPSAVTVVVLGLSALPLLIWAAALFPYVLLLIAFFPYAFLLFLALPLLLVGAPAAAVSTADRLLRARMDAARPAGARAAAEHADVRADDASLRALLLLAMAAFVFAAAANAAVLTGLYARDDGDGRAYGDVLANALGSFVKDVGLEWTVREADAADVFTAGDELEALARAEGESVRWPFALDPPAQVQLGLALGFWLFRALALAYAAGARRLALDAPAGARLNSLATELPARVIALVGFGGARALAGGPAAAQLTTAARALLLSRPPTAAEALEPPRARATAPSPARALALGADGEIRGGATEFRLALTWLRLKRAVGVRAAIVLVPAMRDTGVRLDLRDAPRDAAVAELRDELLSLCESADADVATDGAGGERVSALSLDKLAHSQLAAEIELIDLRGCAELGANGANVALTLARACPRLLGVLGYFRYEPNARTLVGQQGLTDAALGAVVRLVLRARAGTAGVRELDVARAPLSWRAIAAAAEACSASLEALKLPAPPPTPPPAPPPPPTTMTTTMATVGADRTEGGNSQIGVDAPTTQSAELLAAPTTTTTTTTTPTAAAAESDAPLPLMTDEQLLELVRRCPGLVHVTGCFEYRRSAGALQCAPQLGKHAILWLAAYFERRAGGAGLAEVDVRAAAQAQPGLVGSLVTHCRRLARVRGHFAFEPRTGALRGGAKLTDETVDALIARSELLRERGGVRALLLGESHALTLGAVRALVRAFPTIEELDPPAPTLATASHAAVASVAGSRALALATATPKLRRIAGWYEVDTAARAFRAGAELSDESFAPLLALCADRFELRSLDLSACGCQLGDRAVAVAAARLGEVLDAVDLSAVVGLGADGVRALAQSCPNLTVLRLPTAPPTAGRRADADADTEPQPQPQPQPVEVDEAALLALAHGCPRLVHLELGGYAQQLSDDGAAALARSCRHLVTLDVSGAQALGDAAMLALAIHASALTSLSIVGCVLVSDYGLCALAERCGGLRTLRTRGCVLLGPRCIVALAERCALLAHLDISACPRVTDLALQQLARRARALETLELAYSAGASDAALFNLAHTARGLRHLNVAHCAHVTVTSLLELRARTSLESVDVTGCALIDADARRVMRQSGLRVASAAIMNP
jgi:hypothetical protein